MWKDQPRQPDKGLGVAPHPAGHNHDHRKVQVSLPYSFFNNEIIGSVALHDLLYYDSLPSLSAHLLQVQVEKQLVLEMLNWRSYGMSISLTPRNGGIIEPKR